MRGQNPERAALEGLAGPADETGRWAKRRGRATLYFGVCSLMSWRCRPQRPRRENDEKKPERERERQIKLAVDVVQEQDHAGISGEAKAEDASRTAGAIDSDDDNAI